MKEEALLKNRGSRYSPHDIQNPEFLDIIRRCSQKRKAEKEEKDCRLKEEAARLESQNSRGESATRDRVRDGTG